MRVATAVRERPILFSGEMVRAIIDGRKIQTRRVVRLPQHIAHADVELSRMQPGYADGTTRPVWDYDGEPNAFSSVCPYGQPGDRLWVRETWAFDEESPNDGTHHTYRWVHYRATPRTGIRVLPTPARMTYLHESTEPEQVAAYVAARKWRPSIHMPRWACRLVLEVTDVRVERVQEITEADAIAEGAPAERRVGVQHPLRPSRVMGWAMRQCTHREAFQHLWDHINARRGFGWDANPWVWVVSFRRVES